MDSTYWSSFSLPLSVAVVTESSFLLLSSSSSSSFFPVLEYSGFSLILQFSCFLVNVNGDDDELFRDVNIVCNLFSFSVSEDDVDDDEAVPSWC